MKLSKSLLSSFKSFTALITGGSSGLGLTTSKTLAKLGYNVVICDIKAPNQNEDLQNNIIYCKTDITSEHDMQNAVDLANSKFKSINALINCAGIGMTRKTINHSQKKAHDLEDFERILKVNTTGTFNAIRLIALSMSENVPDEDGQRGVIVNTASVSAFDGQVGQTAYAASKGAIISMTLPIARDLSRHGIRVVTIAPGLFESRLLYGDREVDSNISSYLDDIQLSISRLGHQNEFSQAIVECLENKMLNGVSLRLDGGGRLIHL